MRFSLALAAPVFHRTWRAWVLWGGVLLSVLSGPAQACVVEQLDGQNIIIRGECEPTVLFQKLSSAITRMESQAASAERRQNKFPDEQNSKPKKLDMGVQQGGGSGRTFFHRPKK